MRKSSSLTPLILVILLIVPVLALSQPAQGTRRLIVNGQAGQEVTLVEINGHSYVDLEGLARVANGSLGFNGNEITLDAARSESTSPSATPSGGLAEGVAEDPDCLRGSRWRRSKQCPGSGNGTSRLMTPSTMDFRSRGGWQATETRSLLALDWRPWQLQPILIKTPFSY